ncbi:MAG: Gfo/Idh/MocA family oxidoreductase [Candidatus Omnitrophota bacterium]|nr:Gfo/Idh/MocA family oxidoreductase [Candidatus Omnitrophota bacterium]
MMRVGIVGAGLQTKRRAPVFSQSKDAELVVISAEHEEHAKAMAEQFNCEFARGWDWVGERDDLDVILVCTPPDLHEKISILAMRTGKHVLCEKPLARTLEECRNMIAVSKETGKVLKCGFNHRHHPAVLEAKRQVDAGKIGKPLFARSRYGIIGMPGREKEWRADPARASGGHLMEQGIHAVDLSRWFLGDFQEVACFRETQYWSFGDLEDNAFMMLRGNEGRMASIHTSLLQWKNLFSLEIYGEEGYFEIEGLGGSYGTEKLHYCPKHYDRPFEVQTTEFRGGDTSWQLEWDEFVAAINEDREPLGSAFDGMEAMRLVFEGYRFSDEQSARRSANPVS